jgi:hypothetical protein
MDTEREPSARRYSTSVERGVHPLRRRAIPAALVLGGVGLAAAEVSVGIGWGLAVVGAALALQPYPGSTSPRSGQPSNGAGTTSWR